MDRSNVRYSPLSISEERQKQKKKKDYYYEDEEEDPRFKYTPLQRTPWKSIALAIFLLLFGTFCLIFSYLIFSHHMAGDSSQAYGFLTIGILLFLPGFYETRIAYYSMRGAKGYAFSQIPDY